MVEVGPSARRRLILLSIALFAVALVIRLPGLWEVPRFEDEGDEALWALEIATGRRLPLTGSDVYYGPLFSYLLASVFAVFGANILWPRLLIAMFGALTVPAIFHLGRVVANWRVGLLASTLALASPALVLVSSHYGWSNSLT
ncbi:MAG TPA: hypothetical protein VMZ90_06575, partial [Vicinamibacterales bacterium]|nr:hypothetical protein [Vicinamibacterales bacterium]